MTKPNPEKQRLPEDLAKALPIELRDALQHPFRRRILRTLHGDARKLNPSEFAESELAPCSAPCISYHMLALTHSGLVKVEGSEPTSGTSKHYFSSSVGDRELVLTVLQDTEESDNQFLAQANAG